jgi:hypothetical protein
MKKQIFITTLSALLFTGVNMYGNETAPATPAPTEQVAKRSYIPTRAQVQQFCSKYKYPLILTGAALVGAIAVWKSSSVRAFLGFEDEQEQENKFVY